LRRSAIKALDRFDVDNGATFTSFAVPTIQGEIRRYFRDYSWIVRPPRDMQERALRIEREREQLTNDLGRNPTAAEIAERIGCTVEEILDASEAAHARTGDSLDRRVAAREDDGREDDGATLGERLGAQDRGFERADARAVLDRLLGTLPERDRLVLCLRFQDDLTQAEIGRRIGCSQMHVSRILRTALAKLGQMSRGEPADDRQPDFLLD
jgi:RNA polymerase sigma-B factor